MAIMDTPLKEWDGEDMSYFPDRTLVCETCGRTAHRDDALNRRCDECERLVRQCDCESVK